LRGNSANFNLAAKRSSAGTDWSLAIALSRALREANFFTMRIRFRFFSTALVFAMQTLPQFLV
jgi:hypothetical protein